MNTDRTPKPSKSDVLSYWTKSHPKVGVIEQAFSSQLSFTARELLVTGTWCSL